MNPSPYHKFLDISIIPAGLNPIEANKPLDERKNRKYSCNPLTSTKYSEIFFPILFP
jgi:hypothetical protein